jgi:HAD superfamily hydrolase (TIGR01509 family)
MTPALVIFDCDGVLIDSEPLACAAEAEELTRIGFAITAAEVARRFVGLPDTAVHALVERELGRALPPDHGARCEARVMAQFRAGLKALPGAAETIAGLPFRRCVASSSRPARLALGLIETGLYELFYPHVFSSVLVARGKPAPDLFLHAAASLGVPPDGCLVLEDSLPGVAAAGAAGMRVLGFTGGGHCGPGHGERLLDAGAAALVERFADLPEAIARLA